jgi:hypothetical protein
MKAFFPQVFRTLIKCSFCEEKVFKRISRIFFVIQIFRFLGCKFCIWPNLFDERIERYKLKIFEIYYNDLLQGCINLWLHQLIVSFCLKKFNQSEKRWKNPVFWLAVSNFEKGNFLKIQPIRSEYFSIFFLIG